LLDLTDDGLLISTEALSLSWLSASLLMLVKVEELVRPPDLFLRNPAILRNPLLSGEPLFPSFPAANECTSVVEGDRSEIREDRVAGWCSLDAPEVDVVD
jgi:hypothetical protein